MVKKDMYPLERKVNDEDLNRLIRSLERGTRILKNLLFMQHRYDGDSVETATGRTGITKMSPDQKAALKEKLTHGQYTTAQVRDIIRNKYGIGLGT